MLQKTVNFILKVLVQLALKVYYKSWEISGIENIPKDTPLILSSNHQNAFMDALLIASSMKRKPWFLARANIFEKKWARKLLNFIRIMPIYRFRDGLGNVKKNDETFEMCNRLLQKKEAIIMFPEGNHASRWSLRPLQRGVARLVFNTEESNNWSLDLEVIPVGIQYEEQRNFRSRVYVQYGEPIKVKDYKKAYLEEQRKGWISFTEELDRRMRPLVLDIGPDEVYLERYDKIMKLRPYLKDFKKQFKEDQKLIDSVKEGKEYSEKGDRKTLFWPHNYIAASISWLNNILLYKLIKNFIHNKVKDKVFSSSLKLAFGLVFVPFYYALMAFILWLIFGGWEIPLGYLVGTAITNYFGLDLLKKWFNELNTYPDYHREG